MRYPAAEKLEIIRLVEQSSLSVRRTLGQLGIPRSTFYCWYDRYRARDDEGLEDRTPAPRLVWNCSPSAQVGSWLAEHGMAHTRGKPYHPMTQGKIERYHRSMKNQILLENYYLPGQLEQRLAEFVDYYNLRRYHESLNNLTPADVYFGRGQTILTRRENIKLKTIELRRRLHHASAASSSFPDGPDPLLNPLLTCPKGSDDVQLANPAVSILKT